MVELVSVVVPAKDRQGSIGRALKSIINQTYENIEIIVVDDGSKDDTKEAIFKFQKDEQMYMPLKYLRNEISSGGAKARNQGAEQASGTIIAFLDSDDEWLPNHLDTGVGLLESYNCQGVYGAFYVQKNNVRTIDQYNVQMAELPIAELIFLNKRDARTSTFIFEKAAFDEVQFDEKQQKHQDWDVAIRFEQNHRLMFNPNATVVIHYDLPNRMSASLNHKATEYLLEKHKDKVSKEALLHFYIRLSWAAFQIEGKNKFFHEYSERLRSLMKQVKPKLAYKEKEKLILMNFSPLFSVPIHNTSLSIRKKLRAAINVFHLRFRHILNRPGL